ncbi:hypothetical protein Slala05_76320 [Streptomyces lavendulae subsp. lavendulae]|nr:hypothetical protein Slala05_76320 [Streptomyces lavendulae subsp. lavendulae]
MGQLPAEEHGEEHVRGEEAGGGLFQAHHVQEGAEGAGAAGAGFDGSVDVAGEELLDGLGGCVAGAGVERVLADGEVPGAGDGPGDGLLDAAGRAGGGEAGGAQDSSEGEGALGGDGQAVSLDGVVSGDGVADPCVVSPSCRALATAQVLVVTVQGRPDVHRPLGRRP